MHVVFVGLQADQKKGKNKSHWQASDCKHEAHCEAGEKPGCDQDNLHCMNAHNKAVWVVFPCQRLQERPEAKQLQGQLYFLFF